MHDEVMGSQSLEVTRERLKPLLRTVVQGIKPVDEKLNQKNVDIFPAHKFSSSMNQKGILSFFILGIRRNLQKRKCGLVTLKILGVFSVQFDIFQWSFCSLLSV